MRQTIEQRRRHLRIAKDTGPLAESQVRRDHPAGVFIAFGQQVEQPGPAGRTEEQIAPFVQNDPVHAHQGERPLAGLAGDLLLLQQIDPIDRSGPAK